jgi:hypothetical protein
VLAVCHADISLVSLYALAVKGDILLGGGIPDGVLALGCLGEQPVGGIRGRGGGRII